jgi:hypothetical protein
VDIRIVETAIEDETVFVMFRCEGGDGRAAWKGSDAVSAGEIHDVELDFEEPMHHAEGALTSANAGRCELAARVEAITSNGLVVLRIGEGLAFAEVDDSVSPLEIDTAVVVRDVPLSAWPTCD